MYAVNNDAHPTEEKSAHDRVWWLVQILTPPPEQHEAPVLFSSSSNCVTVI